MGQSVDGRRSGYVATVAELFWGTDKRRHRRSQA